MAYLGFHPISHIFTYFHPLLHIFCSLPRIFSFLGCFLLVKAKAKPNSKETWSLLQSWTDLVSLLNGDAQVHAAIVAMHIPLLGTPSCPQTSFATCFGVDNWGSSVLHQVNRASSAHSHEGYMELESQ